MATISTTTGIAPPIYVNPPSVTPHRYGLFSAAQMVADPEARFEAGVEWEPIASDRAGTFSFRCDTDGEHGWPLSARNDCDVDDVHAVPFGVVGSYGGAGVFTRPLDEARTRAREHLMAGEERAVEFAIATGDPGNEPSFQGANDLTPAGGAVGLVDGFGILEGFLGENHHSPGVIHAPRLLGAEAADHTLVSRQGERLETMLGTAVAFGGGYDAANVGPDGTTPADGEAWLYATARPRVRRSEVAVGPDDDHHIDLPRNDVAIFATRVYVVGWDPLLAAVRVQAPAPPETT